ncbi:hypothetical protein GCM10029964_084760 [Kibdelosporangium lantanae]
MLTNHARRRIHAAFTGAVVIAAGIITSGVATASNDGRNEVSVAAGDAPKNMVEDFNYPHADDILASRGIKLKKGDGRIILADCGSSDLIQLKSRATTADVCFRASGKSGFLTMEIASVYLIYGGDHNLTATLTPSGGPSKTYDVPAKLWKPVGESDTGAPAALMEIRIAK